MDHSQHGEQVAGGRRGRCAPVRRVPLGVLLLGTLLLGAVLGGLIGRPAPAFAGDYPAGRFASWEADGLNLTPLQRKKLAALESASRTQAHQFIGQIETLRHTLSEDYEVYSLDAAAVRRANQDLNHVQAQLLDLRLSEQLQMRQILSPAQFAQLQAAMRKHDAEGDRSHDPDDGHGHRDGHRSTE